MIAVPALSWFLFVWYIFFLLNFQLICIFEFKECFLFVRSCYILFIFIWSENLCLLIGLLKLFVLSVTIDVDILDLFPTCHSSSLLSSALSEYFLGWHFSAFSDFSLYFLIIFSGWRASFLQISPGNPTVLPLSQLEWHHTPLNHCALIL
jgi:hypothetical protein